MIYKIRMCCVCHLCTDVKLMKFSSWGVEMILSVKSRSLVSQSLLLLLLLSALCFIQRHETYPGETQTSTRRQW